MTRWLWALLGAMAVLGAAYFAFLNPDAVDLHLTPSRTTSLPLAVALLGAFAAGGALVGSFAGVRAGAMLGHHCVIGDHTYVGPNATMCGRSVLEEAAHLGPGAVLMDSRVMGRYSLAGISAAVTRDVPEYEIWFGNPARRVGWVKRLGQAEH